MLLRTGKLLLTHHVTTTITASVQFFHCPLSTAPYFLLTTHYSTLTICYSLLTTHCSLFATHYSLLTTHHSLLTTHYLAPTNHYSLLTTQEHNLRPQLAETYNALGSLKQKIKVRRDTMACRPYDAHARMSAYACAFAMSAHTCISGAGVRGRGEVLRQVL